MQQKGANTLTQEEFIRQVEESKGTLYRVSCAYLRQEQDRADAVQEALLKAWQGLGHLKEEGYFRTWLIRILIRECVNIQRKQKRMIPSDVLPDRPYESQGTNAELREAILRLPEGMRLAVVLFYMEGYPVEEIAKIMRVPKGTVCSRLARAREKIKETLKEDAIC